jgi:hypothetical protein
MRERNVADSTSDWLSCDSEGSETVDLAQLRALSRHKGGYQSNEARKKAWPKLLGLSPFDYQESEKKSTNRQIILDNSFDYRRLVNDDHPDKEQVYMDVRRSLWNIEELREWTPKEVEKQRKIIATQIMAVLSQSDGELHYFQGFHDVVSVLVLVLGGDQSSSSPAATSFYSTSPSSNKIKDKDKDSTTSELLSQQLVYRVVEQVSNVYFRDCARTDFGTITRVISLVLDLVRDQDEELYAFFQEADLPPFFATSWLITWWSHELKDLGEAARVFDVLLASPPYYCLYLCAAYLIVMRDRILQGECDFGLLHNALTRGVAQWGFPVEDVIATADRMMFMETISTSITITVKINREAFAGMYHMTQYQRMIDRSASGLGRLQWKGKLSMFDPDVLHSTNHRHSPYNKDTAPSDWALRSAAAEAEGASSRGSSMRGRGRRSREYAASTKQALKAVAVACLEVAEFLLCLDAEGDDEDGGGGSGVDYRYGPPPCLSVRGALQWACRYPRRVLARVSVVLGGGKHTALLVVVGFLGGLVAVSHSPSQK